MLPSLSPAGEVKWHLVGTLTSTIIQCKMWSLSGSEIFKPDKLYFEVAIFGTAITKMNG